jgi:hypothetical protein
MTKYFYIPLDGDWRTDLSIRRLYQTRTVARYCLDPATRARDKVSYKYRTLVETRTLLGFLVKPALSLLTSSTKE